MQSLKKNVPTTTACNIEPAAAMQVFVSAARNARNAALLLTCAGAVYMLTVSHFRSADDRGYLSRAAAKDEMRKQLSAAADVKGGMLDIYVQCADGVFAALTGGKKFVDIVQRIGSLASDGAEEAAQLLMKWLADNHKIASLSDLRVRLGYSTGKKPAATAPLTVDKVPERVAASFAPLKKLVEESHGKSSGKIAQAIANAAPVSPMDLVIAGIKRMTDIDQLLALAKVVEAQIETVERLEQEAAKKEAAATVAPAGRKPRNKAKPGRETLASA